MAVRRVWSGARCRGHVGGSLLDPPPQEGGAPESGLGQRWAPVSTGTTSRALQSSTSRDVLPAACCLHGHQGPWSQSSGSGAWTVGLVALKQAGHPRRRQRGADIRGLWLFMSQTKFLPSPPPQDSLWCVISVGSPILPPFIQHREAVQPTG